MDDHRMPARVDVVIVTHDTADVTPGFVRSLADHDAAFGVRILVHDNASVDGTPDRIAEAVPEADIVRSPDNLGFAAGVNQALARSDAPWVLLLNPDACPRPGALAAMLRAAQDHPGSVVAPRLERPDGALEHSTHPFPSLSVALLTLVGVSTWLPRTARRHLLAGAWAHDEARYVDWAVGAALLIPRAVLEEVGGLDERFFMYAEDLDWCWRAADHGHRTWFEPSAVVVHIGGASASRTYDARRRTHTHLRNTYAVLRRRWPWWRVLVYRVLQVLGSGRLWVLALARGRSTEARRWWHHVEAHLGRGGTR